jgi:hypothetical protein
MEEKDLEFGRDGSPTNHSPATSSQPDARTSTEDAEADGYEPIRTGRPSSIATRNSRRSSRALSRTRSNNGYGVDEFEEGEMQMEDEAEQRQDPAEQVDKEKDPYEVGWDGGVDNDPLSPRTMKTWRKWSIVVITSMGSFCV